MSQSVRQLVGIPLIWTSHPFIFISLQNVREHDQLFYDPSSNHPIPPSTSVSSLYANLVNFLNTPHLIFPFLPLHPYPERTWIWLIVWIFFIASFFFIRIQNVRELGQNFKTEYLIILSHPLHPSPGSTWTRSIDFKTLSDHHILFSVSRAYVILVNI